jgi:hypothetical protein
VMKIGESDNTITLEPATGFAKSGSVEIFIIIRGVVNANSSNQKY